MVVRYEITGTTKLSKLLRRRSLGAEQASRLLLGLEEAVHACTKASMLIDKVLFSPDFVYLDERQNPNFIFVPFLNTAFDARLNSPFVMLSAMSDPKRMHWQTAEGEWQRDTIQKFVHGDKVFSANKYGRLLGEILDDSFDVDSDDSPVDVDRYDEPEEHTGMFVNDLFANGNLPTFRNQTFSVRREDTGEVFSLPMSGGALTMGSSQGCNLVVRGNPFMQGVHLRIWVENASVVIEDCGSEYGTYAYNRRLAPHTPTRLHADDKFLIGGESFFVCARETSAALR